ncbi:MAG: SDR family NAD(P)-dependent oxidoreductase [Pseudomonadales bacterium]
MSANNDNISTFTADLQGTIAMVTGASKGLGCRCAETLAQAGAHVIAVARSEAGLQELANQYPELIEPWIADVTSESFYQRFEALERLDVLVNNVGTNKPEPFLEVTPEDLDTVIDLNVKWAFRCAQSGARVMAKSSNPGSIIHMSSQMGHVGSPNRTVYCASKHAIEGLTKAMAVELAPIGIRVNSVAPTFIDTPLTRPMLEQPEFNRFVMERIPLGKLGALQDVANAVLFLAAPASGMITGHSLKVDGGWTAQ